MEFNGSIYEGDDTQGGKASFFISSQKWGYASTGGSLLSDKLPFKVSSANNSSISSSPNLYSTARVSPLSLNYYGFCLISGSYYVKLHFAEILITADQTYTSLGRRLFDISIQGKLIKKDFNIMEEAGGAGKEFTLEVPDVMVNSTLEIHLYWAGKGTIYIPYSGVHGPLISAIIELVDPNLGPHYSKEEVMRMLHIVLICTNLSPTLRPSMSCVVSMLEGKTAVEVSNIKRNTAERDARFKAFDRKLSRDSRTSISTSQQLQGSSSSSTQNKDDAREYSTTISLLSESSK